jgi:hypothetical protein
MSHQHEHRQSPYSHVFKTLCLSVCLPGLRTQPDKKQFYPVPTTFLHNGAAHETAKASAQQMRHCSSRHKVHCSLCRKTQLGNMHKRDVVHIFLRIPSSCTIEITQTWGCQPAVPKHSSPLDAFFQCQLLCMASLLHRATASDSFMDSAYFLG